MLKQDRHHMNVLAEELAQQDNPAPEGMYAVRNDGPRVQDGTSYFHGVYACGGAAKLDRLYIVGE